MKKYQIYCDLYCKYAEFPKKDLGASNSCRTFDVLYCNLLEKHVTKNSKCEANELEKKINHKEK